MLKTIYPKSTPTLLYYGKAKVGPEHAWQCEKCGRLIIMEPKKPMDTPKGPCPHCGAEFYFLQTALHTHLGKGEHCPICHKQPGETIDNSTKR